MVNVLYSCDITGILIEGIQFVQQDDKNRSIIRQNLLENENCLLGIKNYKKMSTSF